MGGCATGAKDEIIVIPSGKTLSETTKDGSMVLNFEALQVGSKKSLTNDIDFFNQRKKLETGTDRDYQKITSLNLKEIAKKVDLKKKFRASGLDDLVQVMDDNVPLDMIKVFHLEHHQLSSLPELSYFFNIRKIYLHQNQFESIVDLSYFKNLTYLNMSKNRIGKIENLSGMTALEELQLNDNSIEKIEQLDDLTSLKILGLQNNKISLIKGLRNLKKLKILNLKGNLIEFLEDLWYLNELSSVDLDGNPLDYSISQTALILLRSRNVKVKISLQQE